MAKPTNSIKKIKVGETTYDVVPSMVTDGTYKASCPTLTADATLATTNDLTNNIKEAYLKWGGRNIAGSYAPIDACMNPVLSPNRIAGMNSAGITVEYTNDGTTWTDYGLTDAQKKALVTTSQSITIGKTGTKTVNSKVRVTLDGVNGSVYTALNKMHIYISTNYSNGCKVTMESYDYNSSTAWHTVISDQSISGWSGWNVLNFTLPGTGAFGGTNSNTHQRKIRLTFSHTSITAGHESAGLNISKIYAYGGVGWTTPSTLASNGVPYSYDYAGNITCMGTLRATSLNENGTTLASKYVRVDTASQGLSDTQKSNARTNIGAGTSNFTGYTSSNKLTTDYIQNDAGWTSNVGTVTKVNNTSPDASGNVTINIPTPDYPVTDVKIGNTSIVSSKVATIQTNSTYNASTNKIATMQDVEDASIPTINIAESQIIDIGPTIVQLTLEQFNLLNNNSCVYMTSFDGLGSFLYKQINASIEEDNLLWFSTMTPDYLDNSQIICFYYFINKSDYKLYEYRYSIDKVSISQSSSQTDITIGNNTYTINEPSSYIAGASANGNTLTLTPNSGSAVVFTPTFTEQYTGTVTSVRVQAGTGLSSSQSTAQSTTLNTTISIASGYKLPTTTEWNAKQDALPSHDSSKANYVLSVDSNGELVWKAPYGGTASGS